MQAVTQSESVVDQVFTVQEGGEAHFATNQRSWETPMDIVGVDEIVWHVPLGEDWTERSVSFSGTRGATYTVDVIDCLPITPMVVAESGYEAGTLARLSPVETSEDEPNHSGEPAFVLEWGRWGPPSSGTYHPDEDCWTLGRKDIDREVVTLPWSCSELEDDPGWSACGHCSSKDDVDEENPTSSEELEVPEWLDTHPDELLDIHGLRRTPAEVLTEIDRQDSVIALKTRLGLNSLDRVRTILADLDCLDSTGQNIAPQDHLDERLPTLWELIDDE